MVNLGPFKGNLKIVSQPCKTNLLKKSFQKSQVGPCTLFVYAPTTEAAAALNYSACLAQLSARHQTIFCTLFFLVAAQSVGLSMKAAHKTSPSIPFLIAEISPL